MITKISKDYNFYLLVHRLFFRSAPLLYRSAAFFLPINHSEHLQDKLGK